MAVKERGLKNLPTTADALPYLQDESIVELFASTGVLTPIELKSRYEIYAEQYILSIEVEAKLVVDIAKTLIYPAAINYLSNLAAACSGMQGMSITLDNTTAKIVSAEANAMMAAVNELSEAMKKEAFSSTEEHMQYLAKDIRGLMDKVRIHADSLECEVADNLWPLPKYQEMLFIK
jgi:glutamine synthetase